MDLAVGGFADKPSLHLTAIPDDMTFSLAESSVSMHANSGKIICNNENLTLDKRRNLSSQDSNFTVSLTIKNPDSTAALDKLSVSITHADLADLQSCFPSIIKLANQYQSSNLKGKISGNLEYTRREYNLARIFGIRQC